MTTAGPIQNNAILQTFLDTALGGGRGEIETAPNAGTTLFVQIPVPKEEGA
jgi:hypothetical protein